MDYALIRSRANIGLRAEPVRVEVHLSNGLPAFTVVGLPEAAVRESRDRVRSALLSSHFDFPDRRVTVNLAPADLPKAGGRFDLPIALGILCASGQLPAEHLDDVECFGELALNGELRPVRGTVAAALAATESGHRAAFARESLATCARIPGARLLGADSLLTLCATLRGRIDPAEAPPQPAQSPAAAVDLADVAGQLIARRVLEIAAAGGHNLLMIGPPGTGKSLLASCLPGILPSIDDDQRLTNIALHDLHGTAAGDHPAPFRSPHHSATAAALIGGGSVPRPGEASLAHGGILFLDELPEFSRHSLEMLREPLESGEISLARALCRVTFPARFQLVAAMNPCPCGYAGDPTRYCRCSPAQRQSYSGKISGPLLDRIDLQINVEREQSVDLFGGGRGEPSRAVKARVDACRERQSQRQAEVNARLPIPELLRVCQLEAATRKFARDAAERMGLSARAVHRTLRVARTIADLAGDDGVSAAALSEAIAYRCREASPAREA